MARYPVRFLVIAASMLLLLAWGGLESFQILLDWDDESVFILTYERYLDGQQLYTELVQGYGPVCVWAFSLLHWALGLEPSFESVRITTLIFWQVGCLCTGGLVWRLTRQFETAALATMVAGIGFLVALSEPGHPHTLLFVFISSGMLCASVNKRYGYGILGILTVAAISTKVNIGAFFLAGCGWHVLALARQNTLITLARTAWGLGMLLGPYVLVLKTPDQPGRWFLPIAGTLLLVPILATKLEEKKQDNEPLISFGLGTGVGLLLLLAVGLLDGLSPTTLFGAVLGRYLEGEVSGKDWYSPSPWSWISMTIFVTGLMLWFLRNRSKKIPVWSAAVAFVVSYIILLLVDPVHQPPNIQLPNFAQYIVPVLALSWSLEFFGKQPETHLLRSVAVLQIYGIYPIVGGQKALSFVFTLVLSTLIFAKGGKKLRVAALILITILATKVAYQTVLLWENYHRLVPATHPRMRDSVRTKPWFWIQREWIVRNLEANADSILTYPGIFSFSPWSGKPSRETIIQIDWFSGTPKPVLKRALDDARNEKTMVVVSPTLGNFRRLPLTDGPFYDFIAEDCVPVMHSEFFTILILRKNLEDFRPQGAWWTGPESLQLRLPEGSEELRKIDIVDFESRETQQVPLPPDWKTGDILDFQSSQKTKKAIQGLNAGGKVLFWFPITRLSKSYLEFLE